MSVVELSCCVLGPAVAEVGLDLVILVLEPDTWCKNTGDVDTEVGLAALSGEANGELCEPLIAGPDARLCWIEEG